jgi:small subunit ribosomal protein S15
MLRNLIAQTRRFSTAAPLRMGVPPAAIASEEATDALLARHLSLTNASHCEITQQAVRDAVAKFARAAHDTGSVEVQVAVLTTRISFLTKHMGMHKKDVAAARGLNAMVAKRRSLLTYLKRTDATRHKTLVQALALRASSS